MSTKKNEAIISTALVYKLQTLVDGGVRLTLDLDASESAVIEKIVSRKLAGIDTVSFVFIED